MRRMKFNKMMREFLNCLVLLYLSACAGTVQHTSIELPETNIAQPTGLNIPSPPIISDELLTYYDSELRVQISYPAEWVEISQGVFVGDDGYVIIKKLENYNSPNLAHVAIDFANTYFQDFQPSVHCIGYGNGCAIPMTALDLFGNEVEKVVSIIAYQWNQDFAKYFSIETSQQYYLLIDSAIVRDENLFEPTPAYEPSLVSNSIEMSFPSGINIQEILSSEFNETNVFNAAQEIIDHNCGLKDNNLNQNFTVDSDEDGRIAVKENGETIYEYASWELTGHNPWSFCNWNDGWMMETQGIVITNGHVLNHEIGFDEVFGWHIFNDGPLFFVREDNHYYIFYNGSVLPIGYDEITHYMCCAQHASNPRTNGDSTWFYGRRDGVWYKVTISMN